MILARLGIALSGGSRDSRTAGRRPVQRLTKFSRVWASSGKKKNMGSLSISISHSCITRLNRPAASAGHHLHHNTEFPTTPITYPSCHSKQDNVCDVRFNSQATLVVARTSQTRACINWHPSQDGRTCHNFTAATAAACCLLPAACCLLLAACCMLLADWCWLLAARCCWCCCCCLLLTPRPTPFQACNMSDPFDDGNLPRSYHELHLSNWDVSATANLGNWDVSATAKVSATA